MSVLDASDAGSASSLRIDTARAKINLWLQVTGRRADGYHMLDSLVAFAEIGDRLSADPDGPLGLSVTGPFAGALAAAMTGPNGAGADDNLVLRAARALAARAGRPATGRFVLDKRLPVASGIGGGSADAAAALRLLAGAWGLAIGGDDLAALALDLGADVPVCLASRTARMTGIGEGLARGPSLAGVPVVLINPGRPVATRDVFRTRQGPFSQPAPVGLVDTSTADAAGLAAVLAATRNDLEAPAIALEPTIGRALEVLAAAPRCRLARMSGSGATCFGLFDDDRSADAAAARLTAAEPTWWVAATRLA